jgi:hypothetical protein
MPRPNPDEREPIVFVIDVEPVDFEDVRRTQDKVSRAIRELVEAGVQVKSSSMAVREKRDAVLEVF